MEFLVKPSPEFEAFRILAPDGSLVDETGPADIGNLQKLHEAMLRARRFDERRLNLQRRGDLGTFAPVNGQEAAQVGAAACLKQDDWFVPAFRETAAALWRGASMENLFVVTAGWNEGIAMPEGGRNLPDTVPVASQLPIAVGIAHAGRLHGEDSVVMTFFGDGATSEGDFHEAMNFASVLPAPVVFICQNNAWAISTPVEEQTASATLAQKAHAYGMAAAQVDGNDVLAVRHVVQEAVDRARSEGLPAMVEAITYRMEVHTTADDPTKYRDEDEVERWRDRDPIVRARRLLESRSQIDDAMLESLEVQIEEEIDAAWEAAKARIAELEDQSGAVMFDHLFAEPTEPLRRQRAQFEREEAPRDG